MQIGDEATSVFQTGKEKDADMLCGMPQKGK
jgi:hypothetical protein